MGGNWANRNHEGDRDDARIFARLRSILLRHAGHLDVSDDGASEVSISGPLMQRWNKNLWFGAVRMGKAYVSYHLMPVYMYPDLLDDASPELRARMQGKSCFNFKRVDEELFAQLDELSARSVKRLVREGIL